MPDSPLKIAQRQAKPQTSAAELIECIETHDLGTSEGKREMWRLLGRLPAFYKPEVQRLRDAYLAQRFHIRDANRLAVLDIVATLPTAHELPAGMLDSMRPDGAVREPPKGSTYAERDAVKAQREAVSQDESTAEVPAPRPRKRPETVETRRDRLVAEVQALTEGNPKWQRPSLRRNIDWIGSRMLFSFERLDASDIPCLWALFTLLWAQKNETEYRRTYDSKIVPAKGLAEDEDKGLLDTGDPIGDIIDQLLEVRDSGTGESHVPMRHLQTTEPDGNDTGPSGGVHGMPCSPVERREGGDTGAPGGPGGGADGEPGAVLHGSPPGDRGNADGDAPLPGAIGESDPGGGTSSGDIPVSLQKRPPGDFGHNFAGTADPGEAPPVGPDG